MRNFAFATLVAGLSLLLSGAAIAEDEAAVRDAVLRHYAAIGAEDMKTVVDQHAPHFTGFFNDMGLLRDLGTRQHQQEQFGANRTAGWKWNVEVKHLTITIHGNVAVAYFYVSGTLTLPGEAARPGTWRVTEAWVKESGKWLEFHHHDSPVIISP